MDKRKKRLPASMIIEAAGGNRPKMETKHEFEDLSLSVDEVILQAFNLDIQNYILKAVEERFKPVYYQAQETIERSSAAESAVKIMKDEFNMFRSSISSKFTNFLSI